MAAISLDDKTLWRHAGAHRAPAARGVVVTYPLGDAALQHGHMEATRNELARRLAALTGFAFAGEYDPREAKAPLYFVPSDTLDHDTAVRAGIRRQSDLFGGVVPHPFVATKTITHPLVDAPSCVPMGWSREFARRVEPVVLNGVSAFAKEDALGAGSRLLEEGAVRVKPGGGIAGLGQSVVDNVIDLAVALEAIEPDVMARLGVVVEQNLSDVTTYSVGQVRVADLVCHLLWDAVHDDQQSRRRGLRRLGLDRRAWRFRRDARPAVAGGCRRWRSIRRAPTTLRRTSASKACSRRGATTTSRRAAMARAAGVRECSSSPGAWAGRAAPRSARSKPFAPTRRSMSCARRRARSMATRRSSRPERWSTTRVTDESVGALTKYALTERHADAR